MSIIETCRVRHNGSDGWGLISKGVICPTISWCGSEGVAGGLGKHGYPDHTVLQWADDKHSHDATLHESVPWSSVPWPPGSTRVVTPPIVAPAALVRVIVPKAHDGVTYDAVPAVAGAPVQAVAGVLLVVPPEVKVEAPVEIPVPAEPPRKSLLVRRSFPTSAPNIQPTVHLPSAPEPERVNSGVMVANAAPVAEDVATENLRVYDKKPLTLAEKIALRKAQG